MKNNNNQVDKDHCKALLDAAYLYLTPFIIIRNENGLKKIKNGTAFFLDTGSRKFAVTAHHVFAEYKAAKEACGDKAECYIGNIKFDPMARLIAFDEDLDIATFDILEVEVKRNNQYFLTGSQSSWPPKPPQEDRSVIVAGFPGCERIDCSGSMDFGRSGFVDFVQSVGEKNVICHLNYDNMIDVVGRGVVPPQGYDLRGISGAPLITIVDHDSGLQSWRLGGVVYEAVIKKIAYFMGLFMLRVRILSMQMAL